MMFLYSVRLQNHYLLNGMMCMSVYYKRPTIITQSTNRMEPQNEDIFSAFKRPRTDNYTDHSQPLKKLHLDSALEPDHNPVDAVALLESNLVKQTLLQPIEEPESEDDPVADRYKLDKINIEMFKEEEGCLHEAYVPEGYQRTIYNGPLNARKYAFELDEFQKKAVRAIESNESVLVCAHTSAGKTAVAEYAIQLSKNRNSRVIYTSPIKALSNQKYRDLKQDFQDVGLITGDVTIDPESTCLVMTTEVLRSMIYRGSQIIREVKWVIFDQIHYMRDKERGVVWEQTIILLPDTVKLLFLSATIGNPGQFARWVTRLKKQPCNVIYRDYRPVPLEHYLCPSRSDGIYLVVDEKGRFVEDNFYKAIEKLGDSVDVVGMSKRNKGSNSGGADLNKLIKLIMERKLDPVIVFSFNKKDIEAYAMSMVKFDFNTTKEKQKIREIYRNAINVLSEQDRKLPPITSIISILERGIGIHHGGLLPLIKELIEILFQEGLLKCLFSTETFSMGLNMPARTVVFTSIRKFDGQQNRWITGGEYIQMSGRAGRRGKDSKGVTILMIDEKMEPEVAKTMLKGQSDDLVSSFYINYNMMLNSLRLEDIHPEYIIRRSFLQFQSEEKLPKLMQDYNTKLKEYQNIEVSSMAEVEKLYYLNERMEEYKEEIRKLTMKPNIALNYLNLGRIVRIKDKNTDWGYGMSVNFHERKDKSRNKKATLASEEPLYLIDIMVYIKERKNNEQPVPMPFSEVGGQLAVLTFTLSSIYEITTLKIGELPSDLEVAGSKKLILDTLRKILERKTLPVIELSSDNPVQLETYKLLHKVETERNSYKDFEKFLPEYSIKKKLYESLKDDMKVIKQSTSMVLSKEKRAMERVLRRTAMIEKGIVTLKGSVACQISSNHQILLTHLLFSGFFSGMEPHEMAAVLSTVVHDERSNSDKKIIPQEKLNLKYQELLVQAKSIYQILSQCKVQIEEEEYMESIKEALIDVTYSWCKGASFEEICKMTDCYEGSVIRTLRRLDELLKQMGNACKVIGNQDLQSKFVEASESLRRGIVFAASLHL